MIDAVILNRNLGEVCDALYEELDQTRQVSSIIVVDCSTQLKLASKFKTVKVDSPEVRKNGLRFGRGMNLGLNFLARSSSREAWTLLLPVDTEFVHLDIHLLINRLEGIPSVVAVKPISDGSPFVDLMGSRDFALGWNLEEGPWLVRGDFVEFQQRMNAEGSFFDENNFRGYLTSLDLAFRAYANGFGVGLTSAIVVNENESYLIERSKLIATEPLEENERLMVEEGISWLRSKYGIDDPWSFAMVVRSLYERFFVEFPEARPYRLNGALHEN